MTKTPARTQHDILREVHPDVGEIKEHVVEEQGAKINEIAEQVTQVADTVAPPKTNALTQLASSTPGYFTRETPAVLGFLRVRAQRAQAG
jgi:hypothetical protein